MQYMLTDYIPGAFYSALCRPDYACFRQSRIETLQRFHGRSRINIIRRAIFHNWQQVQDVISQFPVVTLVIQVAMLVSDYRSTFGSR